MLNRIRVLGRRIRGLFSRRRLDEEFQQELDSHLEMLTEENLRRGLSPDEARRTARVQLGGITQLREIHREMWSLPWIETILLDVRYGLRQLRRNPGFTAVAILTLALGIGGTTAIFSVVYGVLLHPFPYDTHRLILMRFDDAKRNIIGGNAWVSPAEFLDYREQNNVFDQVIGGAPDTVPLIERNLPKMMRVGWVTGNFLQVIGAKPLVGRTITPADCKPGAPPVAMLTYKTWTSMFDRDPKAVGRTLILNDRPTTIIGVLPPRFTPFGGKIILPVVLSHALTSPLLSTYVFVIGHLKPGVTFQQANADIAMLARRFARIYPKDHPKDVTFRAIRYVRYGRWRRQVWTILLLMGGVGLLLLMACVNIANLLLARASTRRHEIAIRAALGAGRARLVRQFLLESLLLAAAGGAVGCLLAWSGLNYLVGIIPPFYIPNEAVIRINFPVLAFTAGVAVVSTLLFGLVPALLAARKNLQTALNVSGRTSTKGPCRHWLRNPLVVSEVALSLVLLTGAGLLFRSFWTLEHIKPGYNISNVLKVETGLPEDRYKTVEQRNRFYLDALQRVRALPGVVSAALNWLPIEDTPSAQIELVGQSSQGSQTVWIRVVGDRFFKTLDIPLLAGRTISEEDMVQHRHVIVVNQAFVNNYFEGANPLGQQIKLKPPDWFPNLKETGFEIVGVVGDTVHGDWTNWATAGYPTIKPQIFVPFTLVGKSYAQVLVRTAGNPAALTNTLRKEYAAIDKELPADVAPLGDDLKGWYIEPRFVMDMMASFALLGLVLVCVGVYGVLSYSVSQRTQEFGVRMALGATVANVRGMVLAWGLRWLAIGIGIGIPASIALEKIFQNSIWGIKSADPLTLVAVSLVLTAVGLVACYIPARRAAKVDPMVALRYE